MYWILLNSNTKAPTLTLLKLMQPTGAGCTDFSCMEVRIPKKKLFSLPFTGRSTAIRLRR